MVKNINTEFIHTDIIYRVPYHMSIIHMSRLIDSHVSFRAFNQLSKLFSSEDDSMTDHFKVLGLGMNNP